MTEKCELPRFVDIWTAADVFRKAAADMDAAVRAYREASEQVLGDVSNWCAGYPHGQEVLEALYARIPWLKKYVAEQHYRGGERFGANDLRDVVRVCASLVEKAHAARQEKEK